MSDPQPNDAFTWTQEPWAAPCGARACLPPISFPPATWCCERIRRMDSRGLFLGRPRGSAPSGRTSPRYSRRGEAGGTEPGWTRPEADVIVTRGSVGRHRRARRRLCAGAAVRSDARRLGAAHAGWRGTASGASAAAVRAMQREFRSRPADLIAAIGPCLGACCGEVGPEVVEAFRAGGADRGSIAAWFTPGDGDRSFLDLERANREKLIAAGLNPDAVFTSGLCTKRIRIGCISSPVARAAPRGRMLGAIRCA